MELSEFHEAIKGCRDFPGNYIGCYTGTVYFLFQLHMIAARLDDVTNFKFEDITVNMEFPFTLKKKFHGVRIFWKNAKVLIEL